MSSPSNPSAGTAAETLLSRESVNGIYTAAMNGDRVYTTQILMLCESHTELWAQNERLRHVLANLSMDAEAALHAPDQEKR